MYQLNHNTFAQHTDFLLTRTCDRASISGKVLIRYYLCCDLQPDLPNVLLFCWQELVTKYEYQAKFWSDIICVVTCNLIYTHLSLLLLLQMESFDTTHYSMIWWSNLLRLKVFNLTFASLSYSILLTLWSWCGWAKFCGEISWLVKWSPACSWKPAGMGRQQPQVVMSPCCLQLWRRKNAGAGLCYISAFSACICALTVVSSSSSNQLLLTLCRLCVYVCLDHVYPLPVMLHTL